MTTLLDDESEPEPQPPVRVTTVHVNVRTEVWAKLTAYAVTHGISKTEALHRAIVLQDVPEMRPGSRLLIEHPRGVLSEIRITSGAESKSEPEPLRWGWRQLLRMLVSGGLPR